MTKWYSKYIICIFFSASSFFFLDSILHAQTATTTDDLQSKIDERNTQIKQLEEEIKQYNNEVINAGSQARTLQNTIKTLDLTKKKIETDITLTKRKIDKTVLTIGQLEDQINETGAHIETNREAIISALQTKQQLEDISLLQLVLSHKNLSEVWNDIDNINQVEDVIRNKSNELAVLQTGLETKQNSLKNQKNNLLNLKQDLGGKKQAVEYTVKEKTSVLAITKNKEQAFKELVEVKEEQKAQFEREVYEFESQLNIAVDRSSYPPTRHGILSWPLDDVFITQKFGRTVGAAKLYLSGSHNGVDFRASVGTRVKNVLDGVVVGTGNTDIYPGCYSFGKWVLVKHKNGLSTIYGHLSVISTYTGQELNTGDLIGYSGKTGYSTGPHLHISVYASQGLRIEKYVNSRGCKSAIIPLADIKAYLDPLAYLPTL